MATCPMSNKHDAPNATLLAAQCPVMHSNDPSLINPLNNVPLNLSQSPSPNQSKILSTERETSSIPRVVANSETGDYLNQGEAKNWVYPSPQQFYNALMRKGHDMPEDQMATMVQLHNFLNEEAWNEVLQWEGRLDPRATSVPKLAEINGKPRELTYKARSLMWASWALPSYFQAQRPFDRHDWVITRSSGQRIRYVIDYYRDEADEDGNPAFVLDVRPASDSISSVLLKLRDVLLG
ncbi:cytochrome c and c1 heme-lyase [Clavulina sp. PMI_390]|nr:cytochrome c and c1 heme-lyase [Clavulina sp. PMI_390]